MTKRAWMIPTGADPSFVTVCRHRPRLVAEVLWQRGLRTADDVEEFLHPPDVRNSHDPFLYRHMARAVERIGRAVAERQPITVYGDYDADGVCATAIMVEIIGALGGRVGWYLPERLSEGYGLHAHAVDHLHRQGTKLIITVDCGSTNVAEISQAKRLGLDVIVLDHHQEPAAIPPADSIINPVFADEMYPFKYHASAGVALTAARALVQASTTKAFDRPLAEAVLDGLLDLAAIATVTDMMPLRGENRSIVKHGLTALRQTSRPGLQALLNVIGQNSTELSEQTIGFQIGPRLNAAGRLDHPSLALELLLTRDPQRAKTVADQLQALNLDRQKLTELAVAEALEQIEAKGEQNAYAAFASHWSPGILGLVAGRLAERLYRPVLVMTENAGQIIGSGRSIPGLDIMTVMNAGPGYFQRYGGHAAACGFTLVAADQRLTFQAWWQEAVAERFTRAEAAPPLYLDAETTLSAVTPDVLDALEQLGPYGIDHQRPKFLLPRIRLQEVTTVGPNRQHLRLFGGHHGQRQKFIGFGLGRRASALSIGQENDLAVEISWNVWQGRRERQMKIIDFRPSI